MSPAPARAPVSRSAERVTASSSRPSPLPAAELEEPLAPVRPRPLDRAGSRMRQAAASASPLAKALEKRLPPNQTRQSALFAELLSDAPASLVERVLHALNPRVEAEVSPDSKPRPARRAVERLREAGWTVLPATGRSWRECRRALEAIGHEGVAVTAGGSVLSHGPSGATLDRLTLDSGLVHQLAEALLGHGLVAHLLRDHHSVEHDY